VLRAYDAQLRAHVSDRLPEGMSVEHDGPITRTIDAGQRGWVEYRDLGDLDEAALDDLIARQVARFAERGESFEWKAHGHDRPAFLTDRLRAAGFVAEEQETILVARIADLELDAPPPDGVRVYEVDTRAEFERIETMENEVWSENDTTRAEALEREKAADPQALRVVVAESDGRVVCAGWLRFPANTEFGTLWGGGTLEQYRHRGIYRAVVAYRGRLAAERGRLYLQVDASDNSRPILERMGFQAVTTTTPWIWRPPRA